MHSILSLFGYNLNPIRKIESAALALGWGWAGLLLMLLALIPLSWWVYRCEGKSISDKMRRQLLAIRIVWVIVLAFLVCGPVLVVSGWVPQRNRLAVMVDCSRSMGIKHKDESRLDQVKKLFDRDFIKQLEDKTGIYPEVFSFSDNVSPISRQEVEQFSFTADGNQTDISNAVRNVTGNLGEGSLLGIVMVSDGVSTTGENPVMALANLRTPVHFIAPGQEGETADMALHLNQPPAQGYLNSSVRVHGEVSLHRVATSSVPVIVRKNGEFFTQATADFASGTERAGFAFNVPCNEEGSFRFELEIPALAGELTSENNQAGFLLKVVRERLNVMTLSGRLSWDLKFIGNALLTDPNARTVHWTKLRDERWVCSRDLKPERAVRSPDLLEDLKIADVLILSGTSHDMLRPIEEELIRRVEAGTLGLLVLPSSQSFAELGYQGTLVEKLLPVVPGREIWRGTPGNMVLPSTETPYNFLRLIDDPIQNVEFFATLPKFEGLYEYDGLKPGSEILINSTLRGNADLLPFMIRARAGLGNVVLISGGPLWPAGFRLVPTDRGFSPYSALIVNMCKWLANRREDAQVSIELASSRGYVGQGSNIRVWVMNSKNELQTNAQVMITIKDERGGSTNLPCIETSEKGCYETAFVPAFRGLHSLEADARYQGRELGRAKSEILVEMPTAEFDDPVIRESLMAQLASDTGGIFATIDQVEKIVSAINSEPGQKLESKSIDLRDSWLLLIVLLLLPMVEWYLRRIRGLS
ncbi:MAG: VWA domain-containing protein [Candidatus Riflebacteria bacterium]|nr:VWA domain-containing protein [Candidatus Riflebacteria bacterium]